MHFFFGGGGGGGGGGGSKQSVLRDIENYLLPSNSLGRFLNFCRCVTLLLSDVTVVAMGHVCFAKTYRARANHECSE